MTACVIRRLGLVWVTALTLGVASDIGDAAPRGEAASTQTHTVTIEGLRFNPQTLLVHPGDRVVWINKDLFQHTATAVSKVFDSHSIAPNASWTYVARRRGEYDYTCTFHPTMKGKLTVH
jgi:plastocyanin